MFYSTLLLAAATALSGLATAQNGSYSTSGPLAVDPNTVDFDERRSWCTGQQNNCWKICGGEGAELADAYPNDCDENTLTYECVCTNGNQPNISDYTETLPFYVCEEWRTQCTEAHPDDAIGQAGCQSVTCGERNASAEANVAEGSASASSSSAQPSATASSTSGAGSEEDSSASESSDGAEESATADNAAAAAAVGMQYGTGILVAGMMLVFGFAL